MSTREKILQRVRVENGCWLWGRAVSSNGYGFMWVSERRRYQNTHRASYEAFVGPIARGLQVLHRCDVRLCVNPAHLFLGTQKDNIADMIAKGRDNRPRGERAGTAKLTAEKVRAIRKITGKTSRQIAVEFGVGKSTINAVRDRTAWKHLP